ncbi:MAG: hypothetical protein KME29_30395 [Calothrix sp. FI2-JRJ7]|jgi:hypothetical protein|nr:hypothetical protein [Calothrix sp. FI2-JRJ7]
MTLFPSTDYSKNRDIKQTQCGQTLFSSNVLIAVFEWQLVGVSKLELLVRVISFG